MGMLKRTWEAFEDRTGLGAITKQIMTHPVPPTPGASGWMYVFGAATLTSFIVAVVSGIPLASQYVSSTDGAYASLQWITHGAILGNQIRGIHFYSSDMMLIFIGIHVLRVVLTGAFKYPREVNWLSGVVLLILTLGIVFTGQILRWDQNGVWTILIIAAQAARFPVIGNWLAYFLVGGNSINGTTLSRFFAIHVFILPGLLFAIIGFHLFLVIKVGISENPRLGHAVDPKTYKQWYEDMLKRVGVPYWPDGIWREVVFATGLVVAVLALTLTIGAPELVGPPDPSNVVAEPRPDWYFLWYFAALALLPSNAEDTAMILLPTLFFIGMFALPFFANKGERNPLRRPWAVFISVMCVLMIGMMTISGNLAGWSPRFNATMLPANLIGAPSNSQIAKGAALFHTQTCEYCHMIEGHGGIRGPDLSDVGSRLTPQDITIRIMNGGENMPAFAPNLTPAQLNDLVAFLSSRIGYNGKSASGSSRSQAISSVRSSSRTSSKSQHKKRE
jgi:ubiquinol-cytochrome c reductase cytochrome b subunit